ncbi:MAG: hypothetical protein LV477_04210 [Candidatus Nitrosotalea sp.]|nr:hypothetical protein [Candidatus Nitrosotalea sp.]
MKTKFRILIILVVVTAGFFSIPPTLTNICNTLEIYDERCPRIGGIQTPFEGQIQIWNTTPSSPVDFSSNETNSQNDFFMDNVIRSSIIHIGPKPSATNDLKVNMTQSLTVAGHMSSVPLWVFDANWNPLHSRDAIIVALYDENHKKISLPINVGTFQQLIKIPFQFCGKGSASYYETGYVPIHEGIPKKILVKYVLPDLLPSGETYRMNFSSPYPVKFEIPDNFKVTYNATTICPVTYSKPHPNIFFYDFMFKMK